MQGPEGLVELVAREAVGVGIQGMEGDGEADHDHQHEYRETDEVEEHRPDYLVMAEEMFAAFVCCRNQKRRQGAGGGRRVSTTCKGARDNSDHKIGTMKPALRQNAAVSTV